MLFQRAIVFMMLLMSTSALGQTTPQVKDPYAESYRSQKILVYNQQRDRFLLIIYNLYFALGCKVFPDEAGISRLIHIEWQRLFNANLDIFTSAEHDRLTGAMRERVEAGMQRAAKAGECDYFRQNPDVVLEFRTVVNRALGF